MRDILLELKKNVCDEDARNYHDVPKTAKYPLHLVEVNFTNAISCVI